MSEHQDKALFLATAAGEAHRFGARKIIMDIDLKALLQLAATLQLALQHPEFSKTDSAKFIRSMILDWRDSLPPDMPATKRIIDLGFHQRFDVELGTSSGNET